MKKLSTGQDSTLGNWLRMSQIFFGKDSKSAKFFEKKIEESPHGKDEEVIANESTLIFLLCRNEFGDPLDDENDYQHFECPQCHRKTYNAIDIEKRYCNVCKKFF